jgi:hypothetical protein
LTLLRSGAVRTRLTGRAAHQVFFLFVFGIPGVVASFTAGVQVRNAPRGYLGSPCGQLRVFF